MPGETPVPSRRSWRSPSPPRGAAPLREPSDVFDPGDVGFDAPSPNPPAITATPLPAAAAIREPSAPAIQVQAASPPAEDPRELARRLAQEAKARVAAAPPPKASGLAGAAPPPRPAAPPPRPAPPPAAAAAPPSPSLDDPLDDDDGTFEPPSTLADLPPLGDDEPLPPVKPL